MNILVLGSRNGSNLKIKKAGEDRKHTVDIVDPAKMTILTTTSRGHDKVFITEAGKRVFAKDYEYIIPRIGRGLTNGSNILRHLNENLGIPSTASADGLLNASNKLKTIQILSKARVQVPATVYTSNPQDNIELLIECVGGLPCIGKVLKGSQGAGVFIIESPLAAMTVLEAFKATKHAVLLQQYLETTNDPEESKRDIRAIVCGDKVTATMMRLSTAGEVRANYSKSKKAEVIQLTLEEEDMAIAASKAVGLSISGVDLVRCVKDEKTYCIEVNGNMSLAGISKTNKRNVGVDLIKYIESKSSKGDPQLLRTTDAEINGQHITGFQRQGIVNQMMRMLSPQRNNNIYPYI